MTQFLIATAVFLITHVTPYLPLRARLISALGKRPYLLLFSLLSIGTLVWMVMAYLAVGPTEPLYVPGETWRWIAIALMLPALILVVSGVTSPNPAAVEGETALDAPEPWRGIFAVTRHPLMWGIGIWAIAHLINRPDAVSALFFGSLGALALGGPFLQDLRKRREIGAAWSKYEAQTSFIPFAAVLAGRTRLSFKDIGWWRIAIAVGLWAALLHLHEMVIGISPLPG